MRKLTAIVVLALLLVPILAPPVDAFVRGGFHGGFHRGGCCFFGGGLALGLGLGLLATAPWWYAPPYAYPAYSYPAYAYPAPAYQQAPPPPTYWYYCQNPQGYYPYVTQCPGGWMTVVPPGATQ